MLGVPKSYIGLFFLFNFLIRLQIPENRGKGRCCTFLKKMIDLISSYPFDGSATII